MFNPEIQIFQSDILYNRLIIQKEAEKSPNLLHKKKAVSYFDQFKMYTVQKEIEFTGMVGAGLFYKLSQILYEPYQANITT